MGSSRNILQSLTQDLNSYISDKNIVYEQYRELPNRLEVRSDIKKNGRIAVYYRPETTTVTIQDSKPSDSNQQLGIDISIPRGYRNKKAESGELPALDIRDKIIDWLNQADIFDITDGNLKDMRYDGSTDFIRFEKFVTLTMNFTGSRFLDKQQSI